MWLSLQNWGARPLEEELAQGVKSFLKGAARRCVCIKQDRVEFNRQAVDQYAHYDGKRVLFTTTDLPAQEVALACKGLWRVEWAFRTLKTPLEIRPVYHWNQSRVQGHVMVCVLAYGATPERESPGKGPSDDCRGGLLSPKQTLR